MAERPVTKGDVIDALALPLLEATARRQAWVERLQTLRAGVRSDAEAVPESLLEELFRLTTAHDIAAAIALLELVWGRPEAEKENA